MKTSREKNATERKYWCSVACKGEFGGAPWGAMTVTSKDLDAGKGSRFPAAIPCPLCGAIAFRQGTREYDRAIEEWQDRHVKDLSDRFARVDAIEVEGNARQLGEELLSVPWPAVVGAIETPTLDDHPDLIE